MFDYIKTLKQLNDDENTYGREIGDLNNTINGERIRTNELINKIQYLENAEEESSETIYKDDNKKLKESIDLIGRFNNYLIKENNKIQG